MRKLALVPLGLSLLVLTIPSTHGAASSAGRPSESEEPPYLDPALPLEARVDDLVSRMTFEEKLGQINMPCVYESRLGPDVSSKMKACRRFTEGTYEPGLGPGGGFFTLPNTILHEGPRQQARFLNELQRIAREKTPLGIPLLMTEEGTHGLMCSGGTIFPEGPALGSTWDLDLLREVYATAAREARAIGVHQLFTLVVEPSRDPRLGRNGSRPASRKRSCGRFRGATCRPRTSWWPGSATTPGRASRRAASSGGRWRSRSAGSARSSCRRGSPGSATRERSV
jgi:hypothetical protein